MWGWLRCFNTGHLRRESYVEGQGQDYGFCLGAGTLRRGLAFAPTLAAEEAPRSAVLRIHAALDNSTTIDVQREVTQLRGALATTADKYGDDVFPIREPSPPNSDASVDLPTVSPSDSPKPE